MTVTGANGACSATMSAIANVNPLPTINITKVDILCNGQSNGSTTANITGTGPFNYTWSSVPVQNTSTANNLTVGNYNVQVVDNLGCTNTASATITQPPALSLSINSSTTSVCAGSAINLSPITAGGTGAYTYVWNPGPTTGPYTVIETAAGNYNYAVTATDANGCVITKAINLTYNPQPTVTVTSATVCAGNVAVLSASGANTYLWMPGGQTGSTYTTVASSSSNVTVIGTAIGCTGQNIASIAVNPLPNVSASTSSQKGCVPLCIDLKSSTTSNVVNYNWSINNAGVGTASLMNTCFSVSGSYTIGLTVTDNNGCMNSANPINIITSPQPVADFNYDPIKPLEAVDLVSFTDATYQGNIVSWNWYFMNSAQYTSTQQNPTFTYPDAGSYVIALVVKNDKGCSDTILKSIEVGEDFGIFVPNSFTPNGDGLNDIFYGKGYGIKKMEMQIFDRWGEKVFTSTDLNEAWDGTVLNKGIKQAPEGTYTWRIKLTNVFGKSKELTGHVTLIK
jgi:gliding motility-associated-like protein